MYPLVVFCFEGSSSTCFVLGSCRAFIGNPRPGRQLRLLSLGFLGVFGGFQAAQGLQSSLNASLGELNLAALFHGAVVEGNRV